MYINTSTLAQLSEAEIRALNPNTSFGQPFVAPADYAYVFPAPQPAYNPVTQVAREITPVLTTKGTWEQAWEVLEVYGTQTEKDEAIAAALIPIHASKIAAIKAERDRRKLNGVKVGAQWIHSDTYSRTQWIGMVIMGASIPAIEWTTMDGSKVTTSQTLAGAVFQGTATLDASLFAHAASLIAQVEAATDPATVDIMAGWPATYEAV